MRKCHISAVSTGYWAFLNFDLCPAISFHLLRGGEALPFSPLSWPNLICSFAPGIGLSGKRLGSTAVDPPPPKGQRPLTLCVFLQTPKICTEDFPLSDVNAKEDLSRTPKGCLGPPREVPDDPNAQKCNKNHWFFNDFEMALNALGGAQTSPGGPPWPLSPAERWPSAPQGAPWTAQHESEVPKSIAKGARGINKFPGRGGSTAVDPPLYFGGP